MSLLSVPNTFVSGQVILSAAMNANFATVVSWAVNGIQEDNIGTLGGAIEWAIATDVFGIDIATSSTVGGVSVVGTGVFASTKSLARFASATAQTTGNGLIDAELTSSSSTIPVVNITNAGTGPSIKATDTGNSASQKNAVIDLISTKKGAKLPRMTTTQREAMTMHADDEGCEIYNTTLKRKEVWNGTYWVSAAGDSGRVVDWPGATIPPHMVDLSAVSSVSNVAPYKYIYNILGTTWGVAGTLPDTKGRVSIGSGSGSGLTARTLSDLVGAETLPAHTHAFTSGNASVDHTHSVSGSTATDGAHAHNMKFSNGGSGTGVENSGDCSGLFGTGDPTGTAEGNHSHSISLTSGGQSATHTHSGTTDSTGTGTHGVMQPSITFKKCIVL